MLQIHRYQPDPRPEKSFYTSIPSTDSLHPSDIATGKLVEDGFEVPRPKRQRNTIRLITMLNLAIFLLSLSLFLAPYYRSSHILNIDLKKVSPYCKFPTEFRSFHWLRFKAPVLDSAPIPLMEKIVSGLLFPHDGSDQLGRAEPGPETDEKWEDFEYQRMFAISSDQVRRLGKDPATTVKFPPEYGLGEDSYMAGLDVFHQIHCLNALRQQAFKDYYWDGERFHDEQYTRPPRRILSEFEWIHLRHCTDMLLQTLTCNPNTEMITMTWMETQDRPWPDFNVRKQCVDFDALRQWRDANAQPREKVIALHKPHDMLPVDPQYWELFGNDTVSGDNVHHPVW